MLRAAGLSHIRKADKGMSHASTEDLAKAIRAFDAWYRTEYVPQNGEPEPGVKQALFTGFVNGYREGYSDV
jgi:hypothetical protein